MFEYQNRNASRGPLQSDLVSKGNRYLEPDSYLSLPRIQPALHSIGSLGAKLDYVCVSSAQASNNWIYPHQIIADGCLLYPHFNLTDRPAPVHPSWLTPSHSSGLACSPNQIVATITHNSGFIRTRIRQPSRQRTRGWVLPSTLIETLPKSNREVLTSKPGYKITFFAPMLQVRLIGY